MENFIFCAVIVKNIYNEEHEKVKATASLKVTGSLSFSVFSEATTVVKIFENYQRRSII